jgi:hypothetical protein
MFTKFIDKPTMEYILDYSKTHNIEKTLWLLPLIELKLKEERKKALKILNQILIDYKNAEIDKKVIILYEICEIIENYQPINEYDNEENELLNKIKININNI